MTVPMSTSNIRADFMISDAAIPQQLEMADNADRFKNILSVTGTADAGLTCNEESAVDFSSMSDIDLARAVVRGDVDIKDVPADRITPDFLVALAVAKRLEKQEDPDKDDEEEFENVGEKIKCSVFNPAEAALVQQQLLQLADDTLTLEIYEILASLSEDEDEDKVTILDGISEVIPEASFEIPDSEDLTDEGFFAEIIDHLVETVAEGQQAAEELSSEEVIAAANSGETAEQLSGQNANLLEDALKNGEIEQPRVDISIDRPEVKTAVDDAVRQKSGAQSADDRSKQLAEELEMLRNAKSAKSESKLFDLDDLEDSDEVKPVQTENPLMADSPVTFTHEDGSEITVRPSEVVKQAAELVTKAVTENKEDVEYSVVLNPGDLGRITVKLTKAADGAISVTIAAENAHTQRILEQNSQLMQSNLRQNGVQLESWQTVSESQQETLAQDYNGSSKNPYYRDDEPDTEDDDNDRSFADIIAAM